MFCVNVLSVTVFLPYLLDVRKWIFLGLFLVFDVVASFFLWRIPKIRATAANYEFVSQSKLCTMALSDEDMTVRWVAVTKIGDEETLSKVAINDTERVVRLTAADKLSDPDVMADTLIGSKDDELRLLLMSKLTDQNALARLVIESGNPELVGIAMQRLKDNGALARVAVSGAAVETRIAAVNRMAGDAALADVIMKSKDVLVRHAAALRIQDTVVLSSLAKFAPDVAVRAEMEPLIRSLDACRSVPAEHRARLAASVLELLYALNSPSVQTEAGGVESLNVEWRNITSKFASDNPDKTVSIAEIHGEMVTISFKLAKRTGSFSHTWRTVYPKTLANTDFRPSDIRVGDLLAEVFAAATPTAADGLPVETLPADARKSALMPGPMPLEPDEESYIRDSK